MPVQAAAFYAGDIILRPPNLIGGVLPDKFGLKQTFVEFLHHLPFYGLAVVCGDDLLCGAILGLQVVDLGHADGDLSI